MVSLSSEQARKFCLDIFTQLNVSQDEAQLWADVLTDTSLRGTDSHGILFLSVYAARIRSGQIKPGAKIKVVKETPTTARIDGGQGPGQVISVQSMNTAIAKAQAHGLGAVTAFNSNHNGAISYYAMMALQHDLIGIAMTNATPRVVPYGGREGLHGTNPMAYAIPAGTERPIVLDFATGHTGGSIRRAMMEGRKIPEGIALDESGRPTTDPKEAWEGWLLPIAGHIGYGLGLLVDIFVGALSGGPCGRDVPPVSDIISPYGCGFFAVAIDPARFVPLEQFKERVDFLIRSARSCPPAEGFDRVILPGQRAFEEKERRLAQGIPIPEISWRKLLDDLTACDLEVAQWRSLIARGGGYESPG